MLWEALLGLENISKEQREEGGQPSWFIPSCSSRYNRTRVRMHSHAGGGASILPAAILGEQRIMGTEPTSRLWPTPSRSPLPLGSLSLVQMLDDVAAVELSQGKEALLGGGPHPEGQSLLAEREL